MKKDVINPYLIQSISELHSLLKIPKPQHPLVSFIDLSKITCHFDDNLKSVVYSFYTVCIKKGFTGKMKYGQNFYDFDEGVMTFMSPGQVFSIEVNNNEKLKHSGWILYIHPDFLWNTPLARKIKEYE